MAPPHPPKPGIAHHLPTPPPQTSLDHRCRLQLTLDGFQKVSDQVPFLADLKPSGKYVMEDLHKAWITWNRHKREALGGIQWTGKETCRVCVD
ncbi:hypothetical protein E2562_031475 [Oryza meyeriana var. granulata]|uniref:Dihydroxy-acid/6-phosphogluconate dehydratase N-terminal domain-containing protein n=1 Tax=Oryza meyeriana var. granulata TaxID=110450 RepID=A0A6G1ERL0_9ORYZ|nr:hypothetical protein E2562_031475 [Oryza meyeriana var. granulata]